MKIYTTAFKFFAIIYYRSQPLALQTIHFSNWQAFISIYRFAGRHAPIAISIFRPH